MIIDYNGSVQLWWKVYSEKSRNGYLIEKKIRKIPHIPLNDGKLTFNKNKSVTVIKISKARIYEGAKETNFYRRIVRIETAGNGKIPKDLTELLERESFERKV